jgi:hypothetical protein
MAWAEIINAKENDIKMRLREAPYLKGNSVSVQNSKQNDKTNKVIWVLEELSSKKLLIFLFDLIKRAISPPMPRSSNTEKVWKYKIMPSLLFIIRKNIDPTITINIE